MNSGLQGYDEQAKLAEWVQIVSQCRSSGLSVRLRCQENGMQNRGTPARAGRPVQIV